MRGREKFLPLVKRSGAPVAVFLVIALFGGYALFGANGLLAYGDYTRKLERQQAELKRLHAQRDEMRNRVALLDPKRANPDLVDELVRKQLNVAHPDDVILPMK